VPRNHDPGQNALHNQADHPKFSSLVDDIQHLPDAKVQHMREHAHQDVHDPQDFHTQSLFTMPEFFGTQEHQRPVGVLNHHPQDV
jgi:hypothetical protein